MFSSLWGSGDARLLVGAAKLDLTLNELKVAREIWDILPRNSLHFHRILLTPSNLFNIACYPYQITCQIHLLFISALNPSRYPLSSPSSLFKPFGL